MSRLISVAPMMRCTDRHDRYFLRLIAPSIRLYTEMMTTQALLYGHAPKLLRFHPSEHPIALQIGGSQPQQMAVCARMAEDAGYDEVNINFGCPSVRVQSGNFGACLMLDPDRAAECVEAMQEAVTIPVTVKCRIGVDHYDAYTTLRRFVQRTAEAGCRVFIVHARIALLSCLNPKQNRMIPPLQYELVHRLKKEFAHLTIILNGGIKTGEEVAQHLQHVDGIMIGREAYYNPYFLHDLQKQYFFAPFFYNRKDVVQAYLAYIQDELHKKVALTAMTRHISGLFHGQPQARKWRSGLQNLSSSTYRQEIVDLLSFLNDK